MDHYSATHLRLCFGALPSAVRTLLHHLEECPACRATAASSLASASEPPTLAPSLYEQTPYGEILLRCEESATEAQARVRAERERAAKLVARLLEQPVDRWRLWLQRKSLRTFSAVERLLNSALAVAAEEPKAAEERVDFALRLLDQIEVTSAAESLSQRLKVRGWSLMGLARAYRGNWLTAEDAFDRGGRLVVDVLGTEEEAERLRHFSVALVREGRQGDALALLARMGEISDELGDLAGACDGLDRSASLLADLGDFDRAGGQVAWALVLAEQLGDKQRSHRLRIRLSRFLLARNDAFGAREILGPLIRAQRTLDGMRPFCDPGPDDLPN